ncbi:hypothetical protein [Streptomyces sp. B6B3]|uniref:hypothetical protein n=1 Tax=Streptomyces sp. B6B3 TaxID=3153570 RepID=UPI00325DDCDD
MAALPKPEGVWGVTVDSENTTIVINVHASENAARMDAFWRALHAVGMAYHSDYHDDREGLYLLQVRQEPRTGEEIGQEEGATGAPLRLSITTGHDRPDCQAHRRRGAHTRRPRRTPERARSAS